MNLINGRRGEIDRVGRVKGWVWSVGLMGSKCREVERVERVKRVEGVERVASGGSIVPRISVEKIAYKSLAG